MREMGDWREYLMERLADPENAINYLDVSLEEYQVDGDTDFFLIGIQNVVEAQGGVSTFAERTGLEQETLRWIVARERTSWSLMPGATSPTQIASCPREQINSTTKRGIFSSANRRIS